MDLIGKTSINPILFYSGKILGYFTWIVLMLSIFGVKLIEDIDIWYNSYISYVILIISLFFIVISLINLGPSIRLGLPTDDTTLKKNGLYKISRNPMYFGFNLLTISSMIYTFNLLILGLGIYSILVYHLIILAEERFLENRFGLDYTNYKKNTRRYI